MSHSNAKLVAEVAKFKLTAEAENDDGAMEVDPEQRSEVKGCPKEKVRKGSEIEEEVADFEPDGFGKMDDIVVTLKQEISAVKDTIWKLEAYLKAKQAYLQSLEQQMVAIECEKAIKVEGQSEEQIFTQDPVKMALEIPLILENILGKLNFTSLMSSRLVANYWNEAALTIFSKTPTKGDRPKRLNLEKFFKSSDFGPFQKLEPKLTKRVYFTGICICGDPFYEDKTSLCYSLKQRLLIFCEKFSLQIEEMDFLMSAIFAPTFLRAITNRCPNLKNLYLECSHYTLTLQARDSDLIEIEGMPQGELFRLNLKTIKFYDGYEEQPTTFSGQLQRIINRAPNLARLKLEANFYPNLTNNKNLKYLHFHGEADEPNFSKTKLSEMLDQVKDSLEVLKIKTEDFESTDSQGFSFPVMKMLKKLIISDVSIYPLEQDGSTIIQTISSKLPNLEHFEIGSFEENDVEMMLNKAIQSPLIRLFKIQTLIMDKVQNPSVLALFSLWFPNLKKLTFSMPKDGEIEPIFSALRGLKLKHFSFSMQFRFNFSDLVKALVANPELFRGLDTLEIHAEADIFEEDLPIVDDLGFETRQVFCEWLRSTVKNMKSVTFDGFNFSGVTALEVISVIREHQLTVHFKND